MKFRITYEIVTPESAEEGDAEERGFIEPRFDSQVPIKEALIKADWPNESLEWTLQEAAQFLGRNGMEDSGAWFTTCDAEIDHQTGAQTTYALHPPRNITPASYDRLAHIFCLSTSRHH